MELAALVVQIDFLKMQIDLEETNYKYALEFQTDYDTLKELETK